jgi:hypothetical protein
MLATIREYALERLAVSGELAAIRARHAERMLGVAEAGERALSGPSAQTWLNSLTREHDDLRAALGFCLETGEATLGLRVASALEQFWLLRGVLVEGGEWLEHLLGLPDERVPPAVRARALAAAGSLATFRGEPTVAVGLQEQSVAIARGLGDPDGLADALFALGRPSSSPIRPRSAPC